MSWNYRVVKYKDGTGYGLHEVFYDKASGDVISMTAKPIDFTSDEGPLSITKSLCMALCDAMLRGVFEEPDYWP